MKAYPVELRERVVRAVEQREDTIEAVANIFNVGTTFIYKMLGQQEKTGNLAPKPHGGGFAPLMGESELQQLRQLVQEQPDATLEELQHQLQQRAKVDPTVSMVCRALKKLGLPRKKKRFFAQERSKKKRKNFLRKVRKLDPEKFVFIDEMGANINLSRRYARAPSGQRVEEALPCNTPANVSVVGALGARKLLAACSVEGAFDGEAFAVFIEQVLAPQLRPGQIVLMDNVSTHRSPSIESAIRSAGATLLNLPAYSPDLDPMESCWSKVKNYLRKAKARTAEALRRAIASGMKLVTAEDIRGWFKHSGYNFASG